MLMTIFKVDYLPKDVDSQSSQIRNVSSTSIQNKSNETLTSNTYNIFKTAINRGTELLKGKFLSKNNGLCPEPVSSNKLSTNQSKDLNNELRETGNDDSCSESSSSSESECSSPDSILTELMYFKPIVREPKTLSTNNTKILRLPSVRSTSSSSNVQTPCSSPFFIPITAQRQSAFSFVAHNLTDNDNQTGTAKKPKSVKRKASTSENKKPEQTSRKRRMLDTKKDTDVKESCNHNTKCKTDKIIKETTRSTRTRQMSKTLTTTQKGSKGISKIEKTKPIENEYRRVTRSMKN